MDDIEKRIELKNLEIKKLRLEQELSNLSNDSYQEPQKKVVNTPKIVPNNTGGKILNTIRKVIVFVLLIILLKSIYEGFKTFKSKSSTTPASSYSTSSSNNNSSEDNNVSEEFSCRWCGKKFSYSGYANTVYGVAQPSNDNTKNIYCSIDCATNGIGQIESGGLKKLNKMMEDIK